MPKLYSKNSNSSRFKRKYRVCCQIREIAASAAGAFAKNSLVALLSFARVKSMRYSPLLHTTLCILTLCCNPVLLAAAERDAQTGPTAASAKALPPSVPSTGGDSRLPAAAIPSPAPDAHTPAPASFPPPSATSKPPTPHDARRAAVAKARQGNYAEALADLKRLHEANRQDSAILYDYIAVSGWAGRYAEAVALSSDLAPEQVPEYVAQAVAAAFRKSGRLSEAQHWYDAGAARFPGNADIALGRALTLGDRGHAARGLEELEAYSRKFPDADAKAIAEGKDYLRRRIAPARSRAAPPHPYAAPPRSASSYRAEQDAAVAEARAGNVAKGLAVLEKLHERHPEDQYLLGDLLFLLQWNKEDAKAVEYSRRLRLGTAPPYAVEAGARALATAGKYYDCEQLLEKALAAQRRNPELLVTAALVFSDIGDAYKAVLLVDEAERSRTPGLGNRIEAVRARMGYDRIMAMRDLRGAARTDAHGGRDARGVVLDLSAAGGHREARAVAAGPEEGTRPPVSPERFHTLTVDAALESAFWGEQSVIPRNLAERESRLRQALALLAGLDDDPRCPPQSDCRLQRDIARIQPLSDLGLAKEAAEQYEAVKGRAPVLSPPAQLAAAKAYMALRQPGKALEIYAAVIAARDTYVPAINQDDLYRAQNGLFWAYLENEQLADALRQAESVRESGLRPTGGRPPLEDTDWKKLDADTTLGYAWLYTGSLEKAERHFRDMADKAPADGDAQSGLAAAYLMRGLPRTALETVNRAQIFSPDDINLATHKANALMDAKDWRAAKAIIDDLNEYAPYSNEIRLLQRRWETRSLYEFRLESNWVSSIGNKLPGTTGRMQTPSFEWRLYSPPIGYDWRLYGGTAFATARYDEGRARQLLAFMGVEYRVPWVTANLEARYDDSGSDEIGASLYGALTPGDHWSFPFSFERGSRDTPLRARNEGITADSYSLGARYYWNESRSARVNVQGMSFSDGNQRLGLDAGITQRVWQEFTHYLDATASVYAGGNSKDEDRPYFNPKAEVEAGGSLTYGAVLWRHYDKALSHAATIGISGYGQRDYGVRPAFSVAYSQNLDWTDRFSVAYGAGFERRPYDGDQESTVNVFINMSWKF